MKTVNSIIFPFFVSLFIFAGSIANAKAPTIDSSDDAKYFAPDSAAILFWNAHQKVSGFRNMDVLSPNRTIKAGDSVLPLPAFPLELGNAQLRYEDTVMTVDEYFVDGNVAGLLVIKDGRIAYERYGLGNTQESRWVSFSVAKSVVSMLVGAAIQDGYIKNLDEKVTDYLPRLKGSPYDQATLRNIMQMASGVEWNEEYADRNSDVATATWQTLALYELLRGKARTSEPGKIFNYNTAETNLVGTLLRAAIGNNLSIYLTDKIWQPFGMESDAHWQLTEPGGGEFGGCCINATLRDYGRLGLFALSGGQLANGTQVLPETWMAESTSPSEGADFYGYLWWLIGDGSYQAMGIFGQGIYMNPTENVVIAIHSAREAAGGGFSLQAALYAGIVEALGD
ncbi:MAG: serine hydrolase [Gammaproteobacteria bacterium]|nr:serine hydrolase [Gammaproteobacteria bacterium]